MKFDKKMLTQLLYVLFAAAIIYVIYTYMILKEGFEQIDAKQTIQVATPPTQEYQEQQKTAIEPVTGAPPKQILQDGRPSSLPYEIPLPPTKLINA